MCVHRNENELLVSIITVVRNGELVLQHAIDSIRAQTYQSIEYIVVDGASVDGTVSIIERNTNVVTKWISEPDGGIYDAMNKGASHARGEIIAFLNADDAYLPDAIAKAVDCLQREGSDFCFGSVRVVDEMGRALYLMAPRVASRECVRDWQKMPFPHPSLFIRRRIFEELGRYDLRFRLAADLEFIMRMYKAGHSGVDLGEVVADFRAGGQSSGIRTQLESAKVALQYGKAPILIVGALGYQLLKNGLQRILPRRLKVVISERFGTSHKWIPKVREVGSNESRRLMFLVTAAQLGGAELQAQRLAVVFSKRGWRVALAVLKRPVTLIPEIHNSGVEVLHFGLAKRATDVWSVIRTIRLIRQFRPTVIHSHMRHANYVACIIRPLTSAKKLICTSHSLEDWEGLSGLLQRITDGVCDVTTVVSIAAKDRLMAKRLFRHSKVMVVPNGVMLCPKENSRPSISHKEGSPARAFRWVTVGRLHPVKGTDVLLRAIHELVHVYGERVHLTIVGAGQCMEALVYLADALRIGAQVEFVGEQINVGRFLAIADGFVSPSEKESFGLAVAEAICAGVPVVATRSGGVEGLLGGGRWGLLCPVANPSALALQMKEMMSMSEGARRAMAIQASEWVKENYSFSRVAKIWEGLYATTANTSA